MLLFLKYFSWMHKKVTIIEVGLSGKAGLCIPPWSIQPLHNNPHHTEMSPFSIDRYYELAYIYKVFDWVLLWCWLRKLMSVYQLIWLTIYFLHFFGEFLRNVFHLDLLNFELEHIVCMDRDFKSLRLRCI